MLSKRSSFNKRYSVFYLYLRNSNSIVKTCAVVITFFICWAPFHVQRLLYVYQDPTEDSYEDINQWVYPLTGCFYYLGTTVNPILYNVMSAKYRNAFKETCRCSPSNPSISRVGLSSVRDSTTICGPGPSRGSQVFRGQSVNYQRSVKYCASGRVENNLHGAAQLQVDDDGDREKGRNATSNDSSTTDKNISEIVAERILPEPKKSSFLVHAKNGRLRYQLADKDSIPSNETHI